LRKFERYLFISDLQIPFEHPDALAFCKEVQKRYKIDEDAVYCVGDELDLYHGSLHKKDPDADLTPNQEFELAKIKLKEWYKAFPKMKLATSNHGLRWLRKAFEADIPSQILRPYRSLIEAPRGWVWKDRWNIQGAAEQISMIHGMGYSGMYAHRQMALDLGTNVVHGHLHSNAGISFVKTDERQIWGMNVASLIDIPSYAFKYGKYNRNKPMLSVGLALEGGRMPVLVPFPLRGQR
jgi:UDP-2,3-diacylglucosamine pyrophosphatase LpxH